MKKEIVGNSVLIAGFGREGQSVLKYLSRFYPKVTVTVADKNPESVEGLNVATQTGENYLENLDNFDTVVRSPGISKDTPEFSNARHITTATNIFFEECPGTIIGITGTKGKSTTSSLIHHILSITGKDARLVGNIGKPVLDHLEGATKNSLFVFELSSYQLDDISYSPHIAVILPISPEHLSYHGSFEAYVAAKGHIVDKQKDTDYVVYFADNTYSSQIAEKSRGQKLSYFNKTPQKIGIWIEDDSLWYKVGDESAMLINRAEIPLLGSANAQNCAAAATVALLLEVEPKQISEAIKTFKPLEHRLEPLGTFRGIKFFNDSLATTPVATIHALEALGNKVTTLIAGGYDRGLNFDQLGEAISKSGIQTVILFPDTGKAIEAAIKKYTDRDIQVFHVSTMQEAVKESYLHTENGSICLMSPSAASFNLFKDYADRGNSFKEWVRFYGKNVPI